MKSKTLWIFLLFFPLFSFGQSIQGNSTVCVGSSTTLSCNACGIPPTSPTSAWSSSNSSVASIDVNGMVTGLNAGTVTITYTDNGGSTVTTSFTVGAIPTLVNNGSITYFCQENIQQNIGFTSNPSSSNNSIKWYDSNINPIIPNPTSLSVNCNIPQNDTNYISQVSPLGCEGPKSEVITIVVATPSAPLTQNLDYCVGDNAPALTAQADIGNTLQWFKSTSPNTVTNSINPSTSNPGQETWLVRQIKQVPINQVCIGPKSSLTVTTHANPNPPSVTTTSFTYCIDDPAIQLAATPDAGHQLIWYGPGNTQSLTAPTPPTSTPGVFTYNVTQQNTLAQNCESTSIAITVTVLDKAQTPTFSGGVLPVEYCVGDNSIPLSASSITAGVLIWYNEDGTLTSSNFGVGGAPTPSTNANAVGTVNYKVILDPTTNPNLCPSDTLIIPVVVHPNPVITTSNQSVCEGGSVTLSATGAGTGGSYYWNGGVVNNSAITVTPQVTTTYTVTGTDQYGCQGTEDATVTVLDLPNTPSTTSTNETLCQEVGTYIPSVTAGAGNSLTWYASNGTSVISGPPSINKNTLGTYTYYVSQTNSNGCESEKLQITINIVAVPTAPTTNPISYCKDEFASSLVATPGSGYILQWYDSDGITVLSSAPTPQTTSTGTTTYYVSQITSNNCESPKASISVTINDLPPSPTATPNAYVYCLNENATTLSATAVSGNSLKWYGTDGNAVLTSAPTPPTSSSGNTNYYVSQVNGQGCESSKTSINIDVKPAVAVPTASPGNIIEYCENDAATPLFASGNGGNLIWYNSDGTLTNNNNGIGGSPTPSTSSSAIGTTQYYVVQQSLITGCDSDPLYVDVEVYANPTITTTSTVSSCAGEAVTLNGNGAGTGGSYSWDGGVVDGISFVPPFSNTSTTYTVTGTDVNGCQNTATATVTVNSTVTPTATPNAYDYCIDDIATTLSASALANHSLKWFDTDGSTVLSNAPTPPTTISGNTDYYVSQIDNSTGCESPQTSINIDVKPAVAIPVASPGNQTEYCENEFATALVASGSGGNLIWYNSDGTLTNTNFGVGGSPTPSTASSAIGTTQYYVVQQSLITGCDSDPLYVDVEVYANPTITTTSTVSSCAGEAVTLNGNGAGTGGSYSWDGGVVDGISFVPPFSNTTTTYTVTGTDFNGCQNTATATLTVNSLPNSPTVIAPSYSYCKDAIATPLLANVSFNHTLVWYNSDGVSVLTAPFTPPTSTTGTFTYYVSQIDNSTGCESPTESIDVIVGIGIPSPITFDRSVCRNDFSTLLTATKLPGNTLNWFDPNGNALSFAPTYNTLIPGTTSYYVSQYDPVTGCESPQDTIDVVVNDLPNISAGTDFDICQGESAILTGTGAGTGGSYSWSSGLSDGVSFDPTATSTYTVTGTDANGCSAADDITITVNTIPSSPTIDPNSQTTFITGSVSSVLSAIALPGFTLTWYNSDGTLVNGTGSAPTPSTATTNVGTSEYLVTQTSTSGCESAPLTVQIVVLGVNVSNDTTICLTDTAQLLVSTYSANTSTFNSTGYTFIGNYNGSDYYISPIDTSWSEVRSRAISDGGDLVNITDSAENYFVTQGLMPYSSTSFGSYYYMGIYQDLSSSSYAEPSGGWFNIDSTLVSHTNWKPGEPNNLFGTEHFGEIVIDSATQVEFWNDVPDTQSNKFGVIEVPTSNSPSWSYLWSTGDTTSTINVNPLMNTQYWVAISDGNNTWYDSVNVSVNLLDINITQTDTILCAGDSSGTLGVDINPGNGPYQYLWNTGSTLDSLKNVTVGTYSVTVTDGMGCSASDAINIVSPNLMTLTTQGISNYNGFDISCSGEADAVAYANANGGTPGYTYLWSNGATGDTVSSLSFGTYFVTVIDSNGCSTLDTLILTEPLPLALNISSLSNVFGNQIDCYGDSTGVLFSALVGGAGGYSYTWNNGSTIDSIYNLGAGTYWVTAQDTNGCTLTDTVTLTQPSLPFTTTASTQSNFNGFGISCNGGNDGSISVSAQGSNAPYSYAWSNGATTASQSNLGQGTYTVVVTDSLGCISNANVVITEPSLLTYSYIIDDVSCYLGQNGSIEIIPQGGVMPYDIQWFNGTDSTVLDSLSSGYFAFTIIDQNNCLVIDSVEIYEPAEIEITVDTIQPTCERLNDGQIDAFIYGGTYPYSYMLNGSPVNLPLDSVAVGSYILTVVDSNSCTQTIAFGLEPLQPSCFMIPNMYSPNYDGYNDEFRIRHSSWSSYTLTIYNSIGQLVYSGSSSTPYWDGITNGDSMPTGDYYYQLITNEGEVIYGYVTLIR